MSAQSLHDLAIFISGWFGAIALFLFIYSYLRWKSDDQVKREIESDWSQYMRKQPRDAKGRFVSKKAITNAALKADIAASRYEKAIHK